MVKTSVACAFFLHLHLGMIRCSTKTSNITCEAGPFTAGEKAAVTCMFHTDMSNDKRGILLEHHPDNGREEKEVLVCHWSGEKQKHQCNADGSTVDVVVNDRLKLEIPTASVENAGQYLCFMIPSNTGEQSQPCELILREATITAGTDSCSKDDSSMLTFLVLFIIAMVIILILAYFLWRKIYIRTQPEYMPVPNEDIEKQLSASQSNARSPSANLSPYEMSKEVVEVLRLSCRDAEKVIEHLNKEMDASNTQYSVCTPSSKSKADTIIVIELSSATLNIHLVRLQGVQIIPMSESSGIPLAAWLKKADASNNSSSIPTTSGLRNRQPGARTKGHTIPNDLRTGVQLFDHVADCVLDFVKAHGLSGKRFQVVLVVSFQSEQLQNLTDARLTGGTRKEDTVRTLLQKALDDKDIPCDLNVVNNVSGHTSTLIWAAHKDPNCKIALNVGDGYNACYLQEYPNTGSVDSSDENHTDKMVHEVDFGSFLGKGCLELFRTKFDEDLDYHSANPGNRVMEKMVCLKYLGEIIRLILEELNKKGLLFRSRSKQFNSKRGDFTRDMVSLVESEKKKDFSLTQVVLKRIQENKNTTIEDCRIVKHVTKVVLKRAAHLAAAGLATLINRIGQPKKTMTVAIGGLSLHIYHPYFRNILERKTWKLVRPGLQFKIVSSCDGSEMGAALISAAFEHQVVTKHKKNANSKRKKKE